MRGKTRSCSASLGPGQRRLQALQGGVLGEVQGPGQLAAQLVLGALEQGFLRPAHAAGGGAVLAADAFDHLGQGFRRVGAQQGLIMADTIP